MSNTAVGFLFLDFLIVVQSLLPGQNYCTMPVALIKYRMMCSPLLSLWVLREGKCVEALHCAKGYSKKECNDNCLGVQKTKKKLKSSPPTKPQLKTKEIPKPLTTCATTEVELKTTTEQYEPPKGQIVPPTRETRRPKRTRRTRRFTIKEIC
ncbi:uncharacterized protein LOC26535146 [Drosophila yakuba]|uniref:Uncharacterized protein n=1 Tax=Drosophila yakuba TaxID=7245 RepID=A0A0R1DS99_DROYA|nr:uncharacterized protein LOC26535146 [Drosophila yakuba]KRJ98642.1 uncharacterized protein Dyak_GE27965 [Drosophila yakuba]